MDSGQLPEPDPPEPPDPTSSLVSFSNKSSSPVKTFTLCKFYLINGVSISDRSVSSKRISFSSAHLLLPSSASESFLCADLNLRFSQISVCSVSGVLWPSVSSLKSIPRTSCTSVSVAVSLVLGLGSSNGFITVEYSFLFRVSLLPIPVSMRFVPQLVTLVVVSCTGHSILITVSYFLPLSTIQVVSLICLNLFTGVVLIALEYFRGLSRGLSLALVQPFTAVCSLSTALCSSAFAISKYLYALLWQLVGVISDKSNLRVFPVDIYCLFSSSMDFVPLPISSSTLCGFVSGSKMFKIRDTSVIEVLIKGSPKWCSFAYVCVAISRTVNCALAAVSISRIISLNVVFNSQGFLSLCSLVVETRGPLHSISCSSVLYASINCSLCFIVMVVSLTSLALLSCYVNIFYFNGE